MAGAPTADPDERDWRLQGELHSEDRAGALRSLLGRVRDRDEIHDVEEAVPDEVVVTHDGDRLFAYAADRGTIERARTAIEQALARDGVEAKLTLTTWSEDLDQWMDPDLPAPEREAAQRAAERVETRTYVVKLGRWIREEFEQSMREAADRLGLRLEIVEHPHLLDSQVALTVTGPSRKVDEFAAGMKAEERATIRTETAVMASPL